MSGPVKKVKLIRPWQTYSKGAVLEPSGTLRDWLIGNGYAELVEAESPSRPARLARGAAKKIADGAKGLFT